MGMIWKAPKLKEGTLVWTYLVGYSLIRIPYEILRVSAVAYIGNTSIKAAYVASAVGIVLGVGMLVYMYRFRFDPDLAEITQWLSPQVNLDPLAVENLVQRAWKIQQQNRRSDLVERVELAMPNFPLSLSESLSVRERQRILHNLFRQLEGQPILGSDSQV
jgi:phosphatidylglycerol:prolipoprotein diacylglycerol transferase